MHDCRGQRAPILQCSMCWCPNASTTTKFILGNGYRNGKKMRFSWCQSSLGSLFRAGKSGIDQWNFTLSPTSKAQDPSGSYIRTWVPELAALPREHMHAPWEAPLSVLEAAGVVLGDTYPERIVTAPLPVRDTFFWGESPRFTKRRATRSISLALKRNS
jgi:FAD binding domain of DNA photolyase